MAQSVRYRRRQDDVVVHKQVAGWRIAVGGHALADDLVDVAGLGDARPGEVDDVPVEVGYRGVQAEESLKELQGEVSQNDGQDCTERTERRERTSSIPIVFLQTNDCPFLPQAPLLSALRLLVRTMTSPASHSGLSSASPSKTISNPSGAPAGRWKDSWILEGRIFWA